MKLFLHARDKKGRVHILQISLDGTYPNHPPSISADVPYLFNLEWSINSRLKDVIQKFQKHLEKLQDFWNLMDDIDHSFLVSDLRYPQCALSHRQFNISNECGIILSIDANDPTSLPGFSGGELEGDVEEKLQWMVSQLLLVVLAIIITVLLIFYIWMLMLLFYLLKILL